jgi:DNA gyrase subunit A
MDIPERERTAKGMPIVNLLPLPGGRDDPGDHRHRDFAGERNLFFATKKGIVKKTRSTSTTRRAGTASSRSTCASDDELVRVIETSGHRRHLHGRPQRHDHPVQRGRGRAMGRTAGGVRGMKLRDRRRGRSASTSLATTRRS